MSTFTIKRRDTAPSIVYELSTEDGSVNLTGATVYFYMDNVINTIATVEDAAGGRVSYSWQTGDTDKAGEFNAEWEVVFSDGKKQTFPNSGYIKIKIVPDLNDPAV